MAVGALRAVGFRAAVLTAATLVFLAMVIPLSGDSIAGTSTLSSGQYTAFAVSQPGGESPGSLLALNALTPGAAEATVSAPQDSAINAVAIDPRSQEVLATVTPTAEDGTAGVLVYSELTGQQTTVTLPQDTYGNLDPGPIAVSSDGTTAWIGDLNSGTVYSLALNGTGTPVVGSAKIYLTAVPNPAPDPGVCALALSPDGSSLYVGGNSNIEDDGGAQCGTAQGYDYDDNVPIVYDFAVDGATGGAPALTWADAPLFPAPTSAVGRFAPLASSLSALAITPDGNTLFVAVRQYESDDGSGLTVPGRVVSVPAATGGTPSTLFPAIGASSDPVDLAVTPDGSMLYIADDSGNGSVSEVPTAGGAAAGPLATAGLPTGLAVTPDGTHLVVATSSSTVASLPVSAGSPLPAAFTPTSPLPNPGAVAVTPDQAPVAALSATPASGNTGTSVTLDASASTVLYGNITTYAWNFGDGSTASTATPTVAHVYATAGSFTATVTETDQAGTSIPPAYASFPVDYTGQTASKRSDPSARASTVVTVTTPPPPPTTVPVPTTPVPTTPTTPTTPAPTTAAPTTVTTIPTATTRPATRPGFRTRTTEPTTSTTAPTTTTTLAPPPPGSPTLTINPGLGPPGFVAAFSGQNFPPNTAITVQWTPGIGSDTVMSSPTGTVTGSVLVFYRDDIGPRMLDAVGYPTATAPFLVVPASADPAGSTGQYLFRR